LQYNDLKNLLLFYGKSAVDMATHQQVEKIPYIKTTYGYGHKFTKPMFSELDVEIIS